MVQGKQRVTSRAFHSDGSATQRQRLTLAYNRLAPWVPSAMGKGASKLPAVSEAGVEFNQAQLEQLPQEVREQIEEVFETQQKTIEELKDKCVRLTVDSGKGGVLYYRSPRHETIGQQTSGPGLAKCKV